MELHAHPLAEARSFLFVPGHLPQRFDRALGSGADAVILDLEDAVAPNDKPAARAHIAAWLSGLDGASRARTLVRINAAEAAADHGADLKALLSLGDAAPAGVVVPKAGPVETLAGISKLLPHTWSVPLVESAQGWSSLDALASAPRVLRLAFGHLDFQLDLGMSCGPEQLELLPVRLAIVAASRRAGLAAPVDSITPDIQDDALIEADTARSKRLGFGARLCIHPRQVALVHGGFAPGDAELAWARRVLQASAEGGGDVFQLDGRMVDTPVLRKAERILKSLR